MTAGQLTSPQHHVRVPHVTHRAALAAGAALAVVVGAATLGLVARPAPAPVATIPHTSGHGDLAKPGEFILGPGNAVPVGIAVALPPDLVPMPGEFRLGPGNATPPGITRALDRPLTRVEPLYAAGEFGLAPGNTTPLGIVVPLYDMPVAGEFRLGPGNTQPPGITVPLATGA